MFQSCGFEVIACDPTEARRVAAREAGIARVEPAIPLEDGVTGKAALHVECSGHEQAVLDGCKAVRKRGEVVMVGVPWRKRTELHAFDILHAVFHKYVVLRSGWEWELPLHPEAFRPRSIFENYTSALKWLADGRVKSNGLISRRSPRDCQAAYQDLMHQRAATPGLVFDWTAL
jgi:threonine dehydrogenase-like Zn-dependent dehydrogenase